MTKIFRGYTILQLNIEDFTAGKLTVQQHLAEELKALVILLEKTHCITTEKLVITNFELQESSLSKKFDFDTFVHEQLNWILYSQYPPKSDTKWLCVDVDGHKIINIYKPPPTQLQTSDLLVLPHPCGPVFMLMILTHWRYNT